MYLKLEALEDLQYFILHTLMIVITWYYSSHGSLREAWEASGMTWEASEKPGEASL
jgi:hypothetical protein